MNSEIMSERVDELIETTNELCGRIDKLEDMVNQLVKASEKDSELINNLKFQLDNHKRFENHN